MNHYGWIGCVLIAVVGIGAEGCCSSRGSHGVEPPPPELYREVDALVEEILSREHARTVLLGTKKKGRIERMPEEAWQEGRDARRAAVTREVWQEVRAFIRRRENEVHTEVRKLAGILTSDPH